MAKSPSISIFENDLSTYVDTTTTSIPAIVGFATKGEFFKAKKVFGLRDFEATFGKAPLQDPWTYLTVRRAFNQTGQLLFVRVGDEAQAAKSLREASSSQIIPNTFAYASISLSITPSFVVEEGQGFTLTVANFDGMGNEVIQINIIDDLGFAESQSVTSIMLAEALNTYFQTNSYDYLRSYRNNLNSDVVIETTGDIYPERELTIANAATAGFEEFTIYLPSLANVSNPKNVIIEKENEEVGEVGFNFSISAKEFGTHGDEINVVKDSRLSSIDGSVIHRVTVWFYGNQVEQFDNLSVVPEDSNFFARVISAEPENGGSKLISFVQWNEEEEFWTTDVSGFTPTPDSLEETLGFVEGSQIFINGTYKLAAGNNGITDSPANLFIQALSVDGDLGNTDEFIYDYLATPAIQNPAVVSAAIQLAESSEKQDFIYLVDPEFGQNAENVIKWHNGQLNDSVQLASEYAATYWPWLRDTNPTTGDVIWVPPSVFMIEKMLFVDKNFGPWFAPAGEKRGILSARGYQFNPSKSVRDQLYGDQNAVNPIAFFSGKGLVVFGQKTTLRRLSAKNRLSVRRMLNTVKKQMKSVLDSILFDPNIPATVNEARNRLNNILERVRQNGGIDKYSVVFDPDPALAQQNILRGIVTVVPFGTVENIELFINTQQVGSEITG